MIVNAGYRGKVGAAVPKFTYTGQYNQRDDGVVELLTSGTITFLSPAVIDRFMVGGGGAGGQVTTRYQKGCAGGGGGGGYTRTDKKISVQAGLTISVTIGAGGTPSYDPNEYNGKSTTWGDVTVNGGNGCVRYSGTERDYTQKGAAGGSGGGGCTISNGNFGSGGSDGNNGESGYPTSVTGGAGQGLSTREFGEATGKLYAGGGGGGKRMVSNTPIVSSGGSGGGGAGGWCGSYNSQIQAAASGVANTGGGGGGGAAYASATTGDKPVANAGYGGSGIVCFRAAK